MEMNFKVVYEIKDGGRFGNKEGLTIKSNIADDKSIECMLPKSLIDVLKKESATLDPEKLLLGFAEAQRRGIEENLEALDDMELRAKNTAMKMQESLIKSYDDNYDKYLEIEEKMNEVKNKLAKSMQSSINSLESGVSKAETFSKRLMEIDNYKLERLSLVIEKILSLAEQDKNLAKLLLEYKR